MEKNNKQHVAELENFNIDSRAYSEGENYFKYDILENMCLSDNNENTQNENELEIKGVLFDSSKVMVSFAVVLIFSCSIHFSLSSVALSHLLWLINLMLPNISRLGKT